jgi:hypothetical protein
MADPFLPRPAAQVTLPRATASFASAKSGVNAAVCATPRLRALKRYFRMLICAA